MSYENSATRRSSGNGWKIFGISMLVGAIIIAIFGYNLTLGSRNVLVRHNNNLEGTFAGINNAAQKRADIVPNMVSVVDRFAKQEKDVTIGATEARAKATSITLPQNATPEQIEAFGKAQQEMSGALGRLLAVSERYPDLKSDKLFLDLQAQLKESETQMSGARAAYIRAVQSYNVNVESCPFACVAAMMFGYQKKPQLDFGPDAAQRRAAPPKVEFNKKD